MNASESRHPVSTPGAPAARTAWLTLGFVAGLLGTLAAVNLVATQLEVVTLDKMEYMMVSQRRAVRAGEFRIEKGRARIVALGDSRMNTGFLPDAFDAATGGRTTSVNLALASHDLSRGIFQLKDYVRVYGAPDTVVLEIRQWPGHASEHPLGATVRELAEAFVAAPSSGRLQALKHGLVPAWYSKRAYDGGWPSREQLRDPRRLWRTRREPVDEMIVMRGATWWGNRYVALPENFVDPEQDPMSTPMSILDPAVVPWLDRFLRYTESIGTRVLLVNTPFRHGSKAPWPSRPDFMTQALASYRGVYQHPDGWRVKFYPAPDFFDRGHLNEAGAQKFSAEVAREYLSSVPAGGRMQ